MKCPKCAAELSLSGGFCPYCGARLEEAPEAGAARIFQEQKEERPAQEPAQEENPAREPAREESTAQEPAREESPDQEPAREEPRRTETPKEIPDLTAWYGDGGKDFKRRRYCENCGGLIHERTRRCLSCGKKYSRITKSLWAASLLLLAVLALAGWNIYQYLTLEECYATIQEQEALIQEQKAHIQAVDSDYAARLEESRRLEDQLAAYEDEMEYYDQIRLFLRQGKVGYASEEFRADRGIFIMKRSSPEKKLLLVTEVDGSYTYGFENSRPAVAYVRFDEESWYDSTTLTITPLKKGVTVLEFYNDGNSETFKVMIVVTD